MVSAVVALIALCSAPHPSSAARIEHQAVENATTFPFEMPWAPAADLQSVSKCIGKTVGVEKFHVVPETRLGQGKSGEAFRVAIMEPAPKYFLQPAILKIQLKKATEELADEAELMKKAAGVPHASQLLAFGKLWVPGSMTGTMFPSYGPAEALLMTAAPGGELQGKLPLPDGELAKLKADLQEFADAMYAKKLFHGDLTASNVFWDGKEATVIDFGNGQDLDVPVTRQQDMAIRMKITDARDEMRQFFTDVDEAQR